MTWQHLICFPIAIVGVFLPDPSSHHEISLPYQVSVEVNSQFVCAGAVFTVKWVLSVATCVYNVSAEDIVVRADSASSQWRGSVHLVSEVTSHPEYRPDNVLHANLALLKLYTRFQFNRRIYPITLWHRISAPGSEGWSAGWGCSQDRRYVSGKKKRRTRVVILQPSSCVILSSNSTEEMCVSSKAHAFSSECPEDLGALLVVHRWLAGFKVVTVNYAVGVYAAVSPHIGWIKYAAFGLD